MTVLPSVESIGTLHEDPAFLASKVDQQGGSAQRVRCAKDAGNFHMGSVAEKGWLLHQWVAGILASPVPVERIADDRRVLQRGLASRPIIDD